MPLKPLTNDPTTINTDGTNKIKIKHVHKQTSNKHEGIEIVTI